MLYRQKEGTGIELPYTKALQELAAVEQHDYCFAPLLAQLLCSHLPQPGGCQHSAATPSKLHQAWKPPSGLETYGLGSPVMRQTIYSLNSPPSPPFHSLQPHTRAQQSFPSRAFFPAAIAGFLQPIRASQGGVPRAGFQQETKPAVRDQLWGNCETCNGG